MMKIIGARTEKPDVDDLLQKARAFEANTDCTVQLFRADRVFGRLHVEAAVEHAQRAFDQGRNRSKHLGTEIMLYCAAERQIKNSIELLGIKPDSEEMVLLILGNLDENEILQTMGLEKADEVLDGEKDFAAYGITEGQVALMDGRVQDLILEKMALSELER